MPALPRQAPPAGETGGRRDAGRGPALEAAYEAAVRVLDTPAAPAEKLAAAWDFLQKFPSSRYTGEMIAAAIDLQAVRPRTTRQGRWRRRGPPWRRIEDPEVRRHVQRQLAGLYGRLGGSTNLQATAAELAA